MKKAKNWFVDKILKRKRVWIPILIVLIISGFGVFNSGNNSKNVITDKVSYINLKQTVLATGQVISSTDLDLSFNTSGIVKNVRVKVGDNVEEGDILATLDQSSELASLTSARGVLAAANAKYKKILEGASNEDIRLSEVILEQTKITQDTLVKNAYENLLNSTPEAVPDDGTSDYTAPTISGTYKLGKEGIIKIKSYYSSIGVSYEVSGLTTGTGVSNEIIPQPIGNSGLYIKFPSSTNYEVKDWVIEIPNKKSSDYLTNYNNYQATLAQAKSLIDQRQAELNLKKSKARQSDIDLANADIISAQGQVEQAQSRYNDTMIRAPLPGTITSVDIKPGELAAAQEEAIVLQDVSNMYLEANVNEANIAGLTIGMPVDINYDAFGTDKIFVGQITKIDPSSTLISGVVNYKITASVEQVEGIRPGMTANMTIKVKEKDRVLAIPSRAIITSDKGEQTIRLVTDTKKKKYKEVKVTTGLLGDGGLVEVTSGLSDGDEFVVLIKTK